MSLPVPFKDFVPRAYWDDPLSDTLATKADEHIEAWRLDVCNLSELIDPARIPSTLLLELGYFLAAGLLQTDSDRTKREKIFGAIAAHKRRGSWTGDVKPKVDAIAGGDAVLLDIVAAEDDSIIPGDGVSVAAAEYWSAIGADGIDLVLGFLVPGDGNFVEGNIYIDVDNSGLTADEIDQIVLSILDSVAAYYRVHLGYVSAGNFIEYTVIE